MQEHRRFPSFGQRDTLEPMFHSRSFIAHAQKARKHHGADETAVAADLENQFTRQLSHLPAELTADLFSHCMGSREEFDARVQVLADILDLMYQQYDDEADPLTVADWEVLRETIDQYALDLDMSLVQYVMERVVSHHAL